MTLNEIVRLGVQHRATDVHIEPGLPVTIRENGELQKMKVAADARTTREFASRLLGENDFEVFQNRGSFDLSKVMAGVQCRINVLSSDRGVGLAIRLLTSHVNTLRSCNLHPSLGDLISHNSGLILLTGATGSGKSTTLAALLEEINQKLARHIITLECPIEHRITPKRSFIRQREVGVHTLSYEQGLLDSLREDPDVIVVGEMREAEAMRLTLNAAETGHLVLATMHSANTAEAIYRIMMSFPPERQGSVLSQLGDALVAIVSHRMTYREEVGVLVPVCEILANHAVRNVIRKGEVSKITSLLQTGGPDGMWTFERYKGWLDEKQDWVVPETLPSEPLIEEVGSSFSSDSNSDLDADSYSDLGSSVTSFDSSSEEQDATEGEVPPRSTVARARPPASEARKTVARTPAKTQALRSSGSSSKAKGKVRVHKDGRIEIPESDLDLNEVLAELKDFGDED